MIKSVLQPTNLIHFKNQNKINEVQIASKVAPVIVIANAKDFGNKHMQARILSFNVENTDKENLPLLQRLAFYPRVLRKVAPKEMYFKQEIEKDVAVSKFSTDTQTIGFDDEFNDFMWGWNHTPTTGYENDFLGYFDSVTPALDNDQFNDVVGPIAQFIAQL